MLLRAAVRHRPAAAGALRALAAEAPLPDVSGDLEALAALEAVAYGEASTAAVRRTGVLALKVGMMPLWDAWGQRVACTVLHVDNCVVTQAKTAAKHGYTALQLGVGEAKPKRVSKALRQHFAAAGLDPQAPPRRLMEFRVDEAALLPRGTRLSALHFRPGQFVDVQGVSKGKGFAGVMKRHGFAGQRASHGVSKTHRHAGSTGQCQDPGRVFKGKKMAGRMGGARVTVNSLQVFKIDAARDLLYVVGAVPGPRGSFVRVADAKRRPLEAAPVPTHDPEAAVEALDEFNEWVMEAPEVDPFRAVPLR